MQYIAAERIEPGQFVFLDDHGRVRPNHCATYRPGWNESMQREFQRRLSYAPRPHLFCNAQEYAANRDRVADSVERDAEEFHAGRWSYNHDMPEIDVDFARAIANAFNAGYTSEDVASWLGETNNVGEEGNVHWAKPEECDVIGDLNHAAAMAGLEPIPRDYLFSTGAIQSLPDDRTALASSAVAVLIRRRTAGGVFPPGEPEYIAKPFGEAARWTNSRFAGFIDDINYSRRRRPLISVAPRDLPTPVKNKFRYCEPLKNIRVDTTAAKTEINLASINAKRIENGLAPIEPRKTFHGAPLGESIAVGKPGVPITVEYSGVKPTCTKPEVELPPPATAEVALPVEKERESDFFFGKS